MVRIAKNYKEKLPDKFFKIEKLRSILIRNGNRDRANSYLMRLFLLIKQCTRITNKHNTLISFTDRYPLYNLNQRDAIKIINR
jgi:hypothetical protein